MKPQSDVADHVEIKSSCKYWTNIFLLEKSILTLAWNANFRVQKRYCKASLKHCKYPDDQKKINVVNFTQLSNSGWIIE